MRGRKPKHNSRADEFCRALVAWKQTPESVRPSLRALARQLGTSHQLLRHYLVGLEKWKYKELYRRSKQEIEGIRARAHTENRGLTSWEEQQLRALEGKAIRSFMWSALLDQVAELKETAKKGPLHRLEWKMVELFVRQGVPGARDLLQKRAQIGAKEKKSFREIVKALPRHEGETQGSWVRRIWDECDKYETNCPKVLTIELLEILSGQPSKPEGNLPRPSRCSTKSFRSVEGESGNSAKAEEGRTDARI